MIGGRQLSRVSCGPGRALHRACNEPLSIALAKPSKAFREALSKALRKALSKALRKALSKALSNALARARGDIVRV
jgi:hypothetical protein